MHSFLKSRQLYFCATILCILISFSFTNQAPIKIGFLLDNYDINRWYKDYDLNLEGEAWFKDIDFFSERIDELGGETIVRVAKGDPVRQLKQARELIEMGVKCLVIVASDQNIASQIVEEARAANVKTIAYDRMINNCEPNYYIAYNIQNIAELQASYIRRHHKKGNLIIINGPKKDANYSLYRKGQMSVLEKHLEKQSYNLLLDTSVLQSTTMEAFMLIDEILSAHDNEIDIILAADDALAAGSIMALQNKKLDGQVVVTGQNANLTACKYIVTDKQAITIYKPIEALAYAAAATAMKLAKNEHVTNPFRNMSTRMSGVTKSMGKETVISNGGFNVKALLITPILVDKDNMKATVITDGHLTEEIIYNK